MRQMRLSSIQWAIPRDAAPLKSMQLHRSKNPGLLEEMGLWWEANVSSRYLFTAWQLALAHQQASTDRRKLWALYRTS